MKIKLKSLLIICCSVFITFTVATDAKATESRVRIGGKDRYETAIQISKAGWVDKSKSVVLATGQDFPDALCAAPLAKKLGAPILLNIKSKLLPEVEQELRRLKVEEITIVGGPGVISDDVLNTLSSMNIKCTRIYGANRYETSIKVAQQLDKSTEVAVATGENFPDAISISSIAAQKGMPILLTGKNNLPSGVAQYLKNNYIDTTYVIGGNDVVSEGVASNFPNVQRLQGNDRFDTNVAVLNKFSQELDFKSIYATTGNNYPDALAASALACQSKSPVCLVSNGSIDKLKGSIASKLQDTTEVKAIGQADVVSEDIVEELLQKYGNTNGNLQSGSRNALGHVTTQGAWDYYYFQGVPNYSGVLSYGGLYKIKKDSNESIVLDKDSYSSSSISGYYTKSNINVFGEWIYYENIARAFMGGEGESEYTEGIYKLKTDGTSKTKICSDNAREMVVRGEWIYYCNDTDHGSLYKIKVDGTNRTKITDDTCYKINISGNYIYYLKYDDVEQPNMASLYRIKVDGTENMKIPYAEKIQFLVVEGDFIYYSTYIDEKDVLKGVSIFKMKTDGTEKVKLCDAEFINSFNVLNGNLYYWGGYTVDKATLLHKISNDGKIVITKFNEIIGYNWMVRNQIYYNNIYRINMDGTNKQFINKTTIK
jgi:putative cell wall-binding protein